MGLLFFIFGTIGDKLSQLPGGYFAKSTIFQTQSANRNLSRERRREAGGREPPGMLEDQLTLTAY